MKWILVVAFIAAIFVAGSNGGSPSEPKLCDIVTHIAFEFSSFTANLLHMYLLTMPHNNIFTNDDKRHNLVILSRVIDENPEVPAEDKKKFHKLVIKDVDENHWTDQFIEPHIWDCLIEIFTGALSGLWIHP